MQNRFIEILFFYKITAQMGHVFVKYVFESCVALKKKSVEFIIVTDNLLKDIDKKSEFLQYKLH